MAESSDYSENSTYFPLKPEMDYERLNEVETEEQQLPPTFFQAFEFVDIGNVKQSNSKISR